MARLMRLALATACATFAAAELLAQTTLEQAMVQAYNSNPTLQADREGLKVLDEDVATARSGGRPTLVGEGNLTRSDIDVTGTGGIIGARLTQPVFRGGRIRNNIRAAQSNVSAGRESLRQSEIDILTGVAEAYGAVLRDRKISELNQELVQVLGAMREAEQRRLDMGERTRTDVYQSQARALSAAANLNNASRRLEESSANFRTLVGVEPDQLAMVPPPPGLPATFDEAVGTAFQNSPRIRQAEHARKVASFQLKSAKGALLPSLDASATVNHRDEIVQILNRKLNQDLATFQLVMTVPVFQGGAEYAAVRRAQHVETVREREIDEITREVYAQVKIAWDRLAAARKTSTVLEGAVKEYEAAVTGIRREADGGSRTTIDVLDAERDLTDAQIQLVNARHEEMVASYRLIASMGLATADQFRLPVERYDPERHAKEASHRWIGFER